MRPSIKWFPIGLTERAAWYRNFNQNIQVTGAGLGLTTTELAAIQADCDMMSFLASSTSAIDAYNEAFQAFRRHMTEGGSGGVDAQCPAVPVIVPPTGADAGIFERLTKFVNRIRTSPGFTSEMEALLGTAPTRYRRRLTHLEDDAAPSVTAFAEPGNVVVVKFVRGASAGVIVETQIDNSEEWTPGGKFLKSPARIDIPHNAERLPRRVQLRARFLHGNDPVGNWSTVVTVQTQA